MTRARLRSYLSTAVFISLVVAGWWWFAPTSVGGSTRYVVTSGTSMQPRFHSGDLAIVRPADEYNVGEIVAYQSSLLHVTVLHRIIGRDGNRYVFKGDNNNFTDPTRPTRSELLGVLWLQIPHGGVVLKVLHAPIMAALVCAGLGVLLLVGGERRRRRGRRRNGARTADRGVGAMNSRASRVSGPIDFGAALAASALAAIAFLLLAVFAFNRPLHRPTRTNVPYTQEVKFRYLARAAAGPVYPTGVVHTGDPIFLALVHRLDVHVSYHLATTAPHAVSGSAEILLQLTGPSGWTRRLVLTPKTSFTGDRTGTDVILDLPRLQSMLAQVGKLIGMPGNGAYGITIQPRVSITGAVAGQPIKSRFTPSLSFDMNALQLQPGTAPSTSGSPPPSDPASSTGFDPSQRGTVSTAATSVNTLGVSGVSITIATLRWLALFGLALSSVAALLVFLRRRGEPFHETAHIQSKYGHMIVPIMAGDDLGWPPVDVPTIKALVQLAEAGQRLILHNRSNEVDTYMVNEEGTVYRYQVKPSKVVWGEWSAPTADLEEAASEIARVAAEATTPSASSAP